VCYTSEWAEGVRIVGIKKIKLTVYLGQSSAMFDKNKTVILRITEYDCCSLLGWWEGLAMFLEHFKWILISPTYNATHYIKMG
jgi:hypothetical protein